MLIGIKSMFRGEQTIQIWNTKDGSQYGEFPLNSADIPNNCIICNTISEFNRWFNSLCKF